MASYYGEADGARVLQAAPPAGAITQPGTEYQLDVTTWDVIPAGEVGDVLFRTVDVSLTADNGYQIGVTPIVDGESLAEQIFSGAGTGPVACQAFVAVRGARIAARVRTLARTGAVELHNVATSFVVIREAP